MGQSEGWWYPEIWPGSLWKHVPWRPHVRPHQDLEEVAQEGEHCPEEVCYLLCYRCYWSPSSGDGQGPCQEDRACCCEDQPSQEHQVHAPAQPLRCCTEEER